LKGCPVIWRGRASQDAFGNAMIDLNGRGPKPRPICVRNHDRPMRRRKSPTASKLFIFIQFADASDARLNALQVHSSETRTRLKTPTRRTSDQPSHDAPQRTADEFAKPNFAAERPRSPRKTGLTIHSTP